MFTGIVHGIATIISIKQQSHFRTLEVQFPLHLLQCLKIGASVSNNGCCLTVSKINGNHVFFDVIQETMKITNLSLLEVGSSVNIERSLKLGDEVGGHFLSGHIIGTAKILNIIDTKNNKRIFFYVNNKFIKYIFLKGFIGIDGISLTVSDIYKDMFCIYFIPETILTTNIKYRKIGDIVNIEVDHYTQIVVDKLEEYLKRNITFKTR